MTEPHPHANSAEQLSPAFPRRAAWGTAAKLRAWQAQAIEKYFERPRRDFLVSATPGAGKTTFALRLALELLGRGEVNRIIVVAPTEHLKSQWADAADRVNVALDPNFRNADGDFGHHYLGVVVTYAQVAANPALHRRLVETARTLVILDEVHHGGDALSWGDAIRVAYAHAVRRVSLTGTPFRSDDAMIPFVTYAPDEHGVKYSQTDFGYGYGDALKDGVVRPVLFLSYGGQMRWRARTGDVIEATLGDESTKSVTQAAWRTALAPDGDWIPAVLRAADRRLSEVRRSVPDAGGLVVASDQVSARAYARLLASITGEQPVVVVSDEADSGARIDQFAASSERWMVAVRMVSEGVDVPRLAVGVYATSAATPLYFAQLVGRFVRARRRGETASIFLPTVPDLLKLAGELEVERDHAIGRPLDGDLFDDESALLDAANRQESASSQLEDAVLPFEALDAKPMFDGVLFEGGQFGSDMEVGSAEELDFIGIPGLLDPDQVRQLLKERQVKLSNARSRRAAKANGGWSRVEQGPDDRSGVPMHRLLKQQRSELGRLVSRYAFASDQAHGVIHAKLRRATGGPAVAQADLETLDARIALIRRWLDV